MNISVIIDAAALAVLILFTVLGWKRGLLRTLTELAVVLLAMGLSTQLASAAAPKIVELYLRPATHAAIERRAEEISGEAEEATRESLYKVLEAIPNGYIREKAAGALDSVPLDGMGSFAAGPLAELGKELADHVLDTLVMNLIRSILSAALFVIFHLLLHLAVRVLHLMEKLPGVRQLNELGGALIGLGKGLILVCLAMWILCGIGAITPEMTKNSIVFGFLPGWIGAAGK